MKEPGLTPPPPKSSVPVVTVTEPALLKMMPPGTSVRDVSTVFVTAPLLLNGAALPPQN